MDWSEGVVAPGQWVHVGFEGPGEFPPFLNWGWWNPFMGNWWGWVPQVSIGWQGLLLPAPVINFTNILPIVPGLTNNVFLSGLTIEYYTNEVALESLNRSTPRSPIRVDAGFSIPSPMIPPGAQTSVAVPPAPPEATHAVVIPTVSPVNDQGVPNPGLASVDWAMIPLTTELPPALPPNPILQVPQAVSGEVILTWTAEPGAIYRVQSRTSLTADDWTDVEGDIIAGEGTASKTVAAGGQTSFYRVVGLTP
jgi:hypothetical protein